jgi:hypothetical protein
MCGALVFRNGYAVRKDEANDNVKNVLSDGAYCYAEEQIFLKKLWYELL